MAGEGDPWYVDRDSVRFLLYSQRFQTGSLLQEFTRDVTEDGPENWYRSTTACFKPLKVKSIHDIFDANAEIEGSRKRITPYSCSFCRSELTLCLDFSKDSLFALFVHHLPPAIHADLSACREIMSRSILHFACFPFSTSEAGVTDLTWDAFIRSLTFLTDRDKRVFRSQYSTGHSENGEIIRESFGRERTITIRAEEIFRSMALPNQTGHHADAHIMHKEDVLDVLHQVQPKPDYYYNQMFCNAKLRPIVEGLSAGRCPLGCYFVPKSELIRLIDFFRRMLRTITTAQGRGRSVLERRLRRKSAAITMIPREKLSFVDVEEVSINTFVSLTT